MTMDAINRSLGRIEGKLDGIAIRLEKGDVEMNKLEDRVGLNEKRWWQTTAAGAALMGAATFILRYTDWIK